jgi:hypothetical protein
MTVPQGLKPAFYRALNGAAEAVPYPKPIYETRCTQIHSVCAPYYFNLQIFQEPALLTHF